MNGWFVAAGLAIAISCSGCIGIVPIAKVYYPAPDPRAAELVAVKDFDGRTLQLADGRSVRVAGIDVESLSPDDREAYNAALRSWVGRPVLVTPQAGDVAVVQGLEDVCPWMEAPVVILIPIHVDVPPRRVQLAQFLLQRGLVKARPEEVKDAGLAQELARADEMGRTGHYGMWERPEDAHWRRFIQPIIYGDAEAVGAYLKKHPGPEPLAEGLGTAVRVGKPEIAAMFLEAGADPNIRDPAGHTLLFYARQWPYTDLVKLLEQYGATD